MLKIVTMLWDANDKSFGFSRCYDESWVKRLYDGFARNLTRPHQFVLFTDRRRDLGDRDVLQIIINAIEPGYGSFVEPYRLDDAMILVGLDTVVTGNIDHLADYCLNANMIALPADPFHPTTVCNGVALVPAGQRNVFTRWAGENDMKWMRQQKYKVIDYLFPGHVVSFKGAAKGYGLRDARIVYFHGEEKPHQLGHLEWINRHWRADDEEQAPLIPEGFVSSTFQQIQALPNTSSEIVFRNIGINSQRKLPWLKELPQNTGVAVIVGGGPSLAQTIPMIKGHAQAGHSVFALNNAASFLVEQGVTPGLQIIIDPRPQNIKFVVDRPAKRFLLSSQCDPSLFESLEGCDVTVLQPAMEGIREHLPEGSTATLIGGGITAGLTAMAAVYTLGYREIHLYGYDSSDADDGNAHAYAQDENDPEKKRIEVIVAGRRFRSSYAMYAQAEKFESFARLMAENDATIHVHGDGLLPTIAREMTKGESHGLQAG
jgi:hypothetical protein